MKAIQTQTNRTGKFNLGDTLTGGKFAGSTVIEKHTETPWPYYVVKADNGNHVVEFADEFLYGNPIRKGAC